MPQILDLLDKVLNFCMDLFAQNKEDREELKKRRNEFYEDTSADAQEGASLHKEYKIKTTEPWEPWENEE